VDIPNPDTNDGVGVVLAAGDFNGDGGDLTGDGMAELIAVAPEAVERSADRPGSRPSARFVDVRP
jgi:hypothetical protein